MNIKTLVLFGIMSFDKERITNIEQRNFKLGQSIFNIRYFKPLIIKIF
jgi:hypothetical protein